MKRKNSTFLVDLMDRIEQNNSMKTILERAIILFNDNPKAGIDFLLKHQVIEYDPITIAELLLTTPGLSKYSIGQYLGKKDEFNLEVLTAFCQKIDFRGIEIDEAMRLFMAQFRLPGEGQQIDRIIEQFAVTYYSDH
jgi:Sec7-like guanine-nucleotide exchange factor